MTSAFNFSKPDSSVPVLPTLNAADPTLISGCINALLGTTPYPIPNPQTMPTQESGAAAPIPPASDGKRAHAESPSKPGRQSSAPLLPVRELEGLPCQRIDAMRAEPGALYW